MSNSVPATMADEDDVCGSDDGDVTFVVDDDDVDDNGADVNLKTCLRFV